MTIRLRPHHLLCMLTFAGKGYTPEFVRHFESVVSRIATGQEPIEIVEGPDEICSSLLAQADCHCHNASVKLRDQQAAEAIGDLLQRSIRAGEQFVPDANLVQTLRTAFATGTIRQACSGCQWKNLCDGIAQAGFSESRLKTDYSDFAII
jgi:hypothetical protein